MFDTYQVQPVIHSGPERVTVNVTEQRAPTDQSVALLKEFEQKALEKIVASISLPNNEFKGQMWVMFCNHEFAKKVKVIFQLNGKKVETDVVLNERNDGEKAVREVVDAVARSIAVEVLQDVFSAMPRQDRLMLLARG